MGNKIKLFVDAHVFDGISQGSVTFLAGLYSELVNDARFQIFVGSNKIDTARILLKSDNFVHIKYNTNSKLKRLVYIIPRIIRRYNFDFAHFQYIMPIQKPCRYVITIHDLLFLEFPESFPLFYRIKNSILFFISSKRADLVTTVSDYSRESIHRYFKIPLNRIKIIPNAVFQSLEEPEPILHLQDKKFILSVGRIEPRKNQASLIRVWKELGLYNQNLDLVMVGSEGLKDNKLYAEINKLSEDEKIHFHWLSNIPTKNLNWLYKRCSLFVFPSLAEGFGIPPLEAAIYGAKVLCSNTTAMKDFNFFFKFRFNPNSYDEFKESIIYGIKNNFNHEFVTYSILSAYNWKKIATEFGDLIYSFDKKK